MPALQESDYTKIYQFYEDMNQNYENFPNTILSSLRRLFGFRLSTLAIFDQDTHGKRYVRDVFSQSIPSSLREEYRQTFFESDPFFRNISQLRFSNRSPFVYTNNCFDSEQFHNSDFGKLLSKLHIHYQAVLGNGAGPNVIEMPVFVLCVYKTEQDGAFSAYELELLEYIGKAFADSVSHYKNYLKTQKQYEALRQWTNSLSQGFAILDSRERLLTYNDLFLSYGAALSNARSCIELAHELLTFGAKDNSANIEHSFSKTIHKDGYTIEISRKKSVLQGEIEILTFITIQKNSISDSPELPRRFARQYHLTEREQEIVLLMADGYSNADICSRLCISNATIKTHARNIFGKLGITKRAELKKLLDVSSCD